MPTKGVEWDSCQRGQGQGAQGKRLEKEEIASMLLLFTCPALAASSDATYK